MTVIGHGIDLVEVVRIEQMVRRHGDRFLERVFTPAERRYAADNPVRWAEHLAGRFAVKEAVFKALGTGWSGGVAWTDVSVERRAGGRPDLVVRGRAAEVAAALGILHWQVSISHSGGYAMASVLALGRAGGQQG